MAREKEAPNVVTEQGLRENLRSGYSLDVVAEEDAAKRHNVWYGLWTVRSVSPDGADDKLLVVSGNAIRTRTFKTLTGLVSFLADIGCRNVSIGLCEGERHRQQTDAMAEEKKSGARADEA